MSELAKFFPMYFIEKSSMYIKNGLLRGFIGRIISEALFS